MSTSIHEGIVAVATTKFAGSNDPVGSAITRDVILNNLCHYADEYGQVRVTWSGQSVAGEFAVDYLEIDPELTTQIVTFGPFPITLREDGSSYKMRVRIGGASSAGHSVTFYAALVPYVESAAFYASPPTDATWAGSTSSTSAAWLTGASLGVNAYETMVGLSPSEATAALTPTATPRDLGGDRGSVVQALCVLNISATSTNVASSPRLYAVYAAEYVGLDDE